MCPAKIVSTCECYLLRRQLLTEIDAPGTSGLIFIVFYASFLACETVSLPLRLVMASIPGP